MRSVPNLLGGCLLLLALTFCGLWARSYWQADSVEYSNRGLLKDRKGAWRYYVWTESALGQFTVQSYAHGIEGPETHFIMDNPCAAPVRAWRTEPTEESKAARSSRARYTFFFKESQGSMTIVMFPHWLPATICSLLSALLCGIGVILNRNNQSEVEDAL